MLLPSARLLSNFLFQFVGKSRTLLSRQRGVSSLQGWLPATFTATHAWPSAHRPASLLSRHLVHLGLLHFRKSQPGPGRPLPRTSNGSVLPEG